MIVSIIIPTYNSEVYIDDFLRDTSQVTKNIDDICFNYIFVDDGSKDNTVEKIKQHQKNGLPITIIKFTQNYGQTQAIIAGLKYSKADANIIMSVDLQESPILIRAFIKHWKGGYKICIAYRENRHDSILSKILSIVFYYLIRIDAKNIPKGGFDYGLMDRSITDIINKKPDNYRFLQDDIASLGFPVKYLPCSRERNIKKNKKITFPVFKFNYFFDGILSVLRTPFKISLLISMVLCLFFSTYFLIKTLVMILYNNFTLDVFMQDIKISLLLYLLLLSSFAINFAYRIFDLLMNKEAYIIEEVIED